MKVARTVWEEGTGNVPGNR